MTKQELRNQIKNIEKEYFSDSLYRVHQSYKICQKIASSEFFHKAEIVFAFMPMKDEVNIVSILTEAFLAGKKVAVPRITDKNGKMEFHWISLDTQMQEGTFDIMEPDEKQTKVSINEIPGKALLLVPGRAFTEDGKRLGRGKGFYDIFLNEYSSKFYKMGICFPFQIMEDIPVDENDFSVDQVIF